MQYLSPLTQTLIDALRVLPGVGPKSAQRMAFQLLATNGRAKGLNLASALHQAIHNVKHCDRCRNFSEHDVCGLCQNQKRDHTLLCIIESPADIAAFEQAGNYRGLYFVLHGHLSPLDGIGPQQIAIPQLLKHIADNAFKEVILATNPTMEGEATAHYIATHLPAGVRASRIAHGVPMGGEIEYLDGNTLSHALHSRQIINID